MRVLILKSLLSDFTFMKDLKNKVHLAFVMLSRLCLFKLPMLILFAAFLFLSSELNSGSKLKR